jgi:mono/diheme cytochrome c family protein
MLFRRFSVALLLGLAGCGDAPEPPDHLTISGADPEQGRQLIRDYGCGTCHRIDGIRGSNGRVGPQLRDYAQRHLLAGILPNTPTTLVAWLMDPPALDPRTGMPNLGVSEAEARHMAAYLYTLGARDAPVYPPDPPLALKGRENPVLATPYPVDRPEDATGSRTRRTPAAILRSP